MQAAVRHGHVQKNDVVVEVPVVEESPGLIAVVGLGRLRAGLDGEAFPPKAA